jgi:hypothetical protein
VTPQDVAEAASEAGLVEAAKKKIEAVKGDDAALAADYREHLWNRTPEWNDYTDYYAGTVVKMGLGAFKALSDIQDKSWWEFWKNPSPAPEFIRVPPGTPGNPLWEYLGTKTELINTD